jgi:hypothetical protein
MTEPSVRGANGGNARAAKLTKEQRSAIAKQAAAKRWAKKDEPKPLIDPEITKEVDYLAAGIKKSIVDILHENGLRTDDEILVAKPPSNAPLLISGPTMTVPFIYREEPKPTPPEPPKAVQKRRKPMVKEFGKAHSYAEKRLAEALKERAESMNKVAMLNAEIPSLVQIIKALGMTPNVQGFQDFTAPIPNMNPYQQPQYQAPQTAPIQDVNPIDPALYATNANPVPGLAPAIANAPVVTNKPLGGAIDLGYTPVDEDQGPGLPQMGGGWL